MSAPPVVCLLGPEGSPQRDAIAAALEEAGATVVARAPGTAAEHARAVEDVASAHGRLDALITSPAPAGEPRSLLEVEPEAFESAVELGLSSIFAASQAAVRAMIEGGGGLIVHVASADGLEGRAGRGLRAACHHGIVGLSQALADEVRRHGVKVVPLLPEDAAGLDPARVAELVVFLLAQPPDTVLLGGVISPVGARRRRR